MISSKLLVTILFLLGAYVIDVAPNHQRRHTKPISLTNEEVKLRDPLKYYDVVKVPFNMTEGGSVTELVFLQYQWDAALTHRRVAVNVSIATSNPLSLSVDKCGWHIFDSLKDMGNSSFTWHKQWVEAVQIGVARICDDNDEYAFNFTINCKEQCNGTIFFNVYHLLPDTEFIARSNNVRGHLQFETAGLDVPTPIKTNIGFLIEGAYINPQIRLELNISYSTYYTLGIGKCGLIFLKIEGDQGFQRHLFSWKESRLLRMAKSTECPEDTTDTVDIVMMSEESGYGDVTYHMFRSDDEMKGHPGGVVDLHELDLKKMRFRDPKPARTKIDAIISLAIIPMFIAIFELFF